jgi:hypothetical protein
MGNEVSILWFVVWLIGFIISNLILLNSNANVENNKRSWISDKVGRFSYYEITMISCLWFSVLILAAIVYAGYLYVSLLKAITKYLANRNKKQ